MTYEGQTIELSKNEYRILLTLLENKGKVVSRETLMEKLWATNSFVDENTLSVNITRIRRKLAEAGLEDFITTRLTVMIVFDADIRPALYSLILCIFFWWNYGSLGF